MNEAEAPDLALTDAAPAVEAPAVDIPAESTEPKSMQEAIEQSLRARDELGRFAKKQEEAAAAAAADPTKPAPVAAKPLADPTKPADPNAVPEGLTPKAQERFRTLVTERNQYEQRAEMAERQVAYVKEQIHTNGVKPEQLEGLMAFAGAFNKGDYQSALQLVDQIRGQISMAMGQPLPGVDVGQQLQQFPDLRQAVDNLQIDQGRALEIARHRLAEQEGRQQQQQFQQRQQSEQHAQIERQNGITAVDAYCKRMRALDGDFATFEERFLPHIDEVLGSLPPNKWAGAIDAHYRMIKGFVPPRPTANGVTVRPAGSGVSKAQPKNLYEAMFGAPRPA